MLSNPVRRCAIVKGASEEMFLLGAPIEVLKVYALKMISRVPQQEG